MTTAEMQFRFHCYCTPLFDKAGKRPPAPPGDLADLFVALVHGLVLQRARDPRVPIKLVFESLMATAEPA